MVDVNLAPDARPLFKERLLWTLFSGLLFFLVYGSANQIALLGAPHPAFHWDWETRIPFIPEFIVPYMSSDVMFVLTFVLAGTRARIHAFALRAGLAMLLSAAFFLILPLQFSFERPPVDGWTAPLFALLGLDQPYNQFPSLHISLGFLCWLTINRELPVWMRPPLALWFLMIAASTLLVWQHHAVDLIGGAAMAALVVALTPGDGSRLAMPFVTPRHQGMGLRYLVLSALAAIAAFVLAGPWSLLPAWIALSMLGVALAYATGANTFLMKRGRRHRILAWLLFWPYLLGCWINWRLWHNRVPLMAKVDDNLWLGARPGPDDWTGFDAAGIRQVIDLAPELPASTPRDLDHHHAPLLDIAIPDPARLDAIARHIEQARQNGGAYVHCALGMSRSVLAIAAWMIRQGKSPAEALAALDEIRPQRVKRPYMEISLNLYEEYLRRQPAE